MQLKDLSKTIFCESIVDDSMLSKSTSTCAAPHSESAHMEASYRAQVAVTVQVFQSFFLELQKFIGSYFKVLWEAKKIY